MNEELNPPLYPGAYLKYSFVLIGVTFKPFSCLINDPPIQELIFEKPESGNRSNSECWMTFKFGPVDSLKKAQEKSDALVEGLLDVLSLAAGVAVGIARLLEGNLNPRPGEGGMLNGIMPMDEAEIIASVEDKMLMGKEINDVKSALIKNRTAKAVTLLKLFRHAVLLDDKLARFIILYSIIDIVTSRNGTSDQSKIDQRILSIRPTTDMTPSPIKKSKQETCYTRLRNEIIHRENKDIEATRSEIYSRLYDFQNIVQEIIRTSFI